MILTFKPRHKEDIIPLYTVTISFGILVATWLFIDNMIIWWIVSMGVLFLPRAMSTTFVHNHAHLATFKSRFLNVVLETILFFLSGMMSSKFKLHHNLGHHVNYLDPKKDPSRWLHKNGKEMSRVFYTLRYYITHTPISIKIGLKHPKLLKEYFFQQAWFLALLIPMFVIKPEATLNLVFIPMTITWLLFITITYDDHVGLYSQEPMEASFSKMTPVINKFILNNGYHMVHHLKPGLHWSRLPEYHVNLGDSVPEVEAHTFINKFSLKLEKSNG